MTKKTAAGKKKASFWTVVGRIILVLFILSIFFPLIYRWVNPPITPIMVLRHIQYDYPIKKKWTPIEDISPYMVRAAIASEDNYFLGHHGFDVIALNTVIKEREKGIRNRGGSTISQQTAKNVFCWPKSSWIRKGVETYFTVLIEAFWPKERIMEVYLNVIEMGPGIYGVSAAADEYFHRSASNLSSYQSALITACYPAPLHRDPSHPSAYLVRQAGRIQGRMARFGRPSFEKEYIEGCQERYQKAVARMKERNKKK